MSENGDFYLQKHLECISLQIFYQILTSWDYTNQCVKWTRILNRQQDRLLMKVYPSCVVRETNIAMEAYNKSHQNGQQIRNLPS